jgi:hypothetical protein
MGKQSYRKNDQQDDAEAENCPGANGKKFHCTKSAQQMRIRGGIDFFSVIKCRDIDAMLKLTPA